MCFLLLVIICSVGGPLWVEKWYHFYSLSESDLSVVRQFVLVLLKVLKASFVLIKYTLKLVKFFTQSDAFKLQNNNWGQEEK